MSLMSKLDLVSRWKLLEHSQFAKLPQGQLEYRADGGMAVRIVGVIDGEEKVISYSGSFEVQGPEVIPHITSSPIEALIGTAQRRYFQLREDLLDLYLGTPEEYRVKIRWQRVS